MIANFQIVNDKVATGAQPGAEDFKNLKEGNYEAILNLSPESTPNYLINESEIANENGIDYYHYPVDCSTLYAEQYEGFEELMTKIENKKIFIHCGGNVKSSGFYYIYQVKKEGLHKDEAIKSLDKLKVHDQKWYNYFERMGC